MAGTLKVNQLQLGDSATATNNFVWSENSDGTAKLARGNVGATTQDILTVDAAGKVTLVNNPAVFTKSFESAETAVTNATSITNIAHGLAVVPKIFTVVLRCKTSEANYAVGDEILFGKWYYSGVGTADVVANATNISIVLNTVLGINDKVTSAGVGITAANWKWVARAWA